MPIFEYICKSCGFEFEALVGSAAKEKQTTCPACAGSDLKKKLSAFAINSGSSTETPDCASSCGGFTRGSCGSGFCGGTE